ncbi:hypothetical protein C8Q75DRAFT_570095 [Abortiporus biennis]|nr:hypothetical protein C8Q75DRAFT_570095 [Abortiporus biennis]
MNVTLRNNDLSPILPWELMEEILDFLGGMLLPLGFTLSTHVSVRRALISCCLVCRDLLPRSRAHLYKGFYDRSTKIIRSFLNSLQRWPHLRGYTEKFYMDLDPSVENAGIYTQLFMYGAICLPAINSIKLTSIPLLNPSLLAIRRPFHSVRKLTVVGTHFYSLVDFRKLVESFFPNIRTLLWRKNIFLSSHILLGSSKRAPSIQCLLLEGTAYNRTLMKWLVSINTSLSTVSADSDCLSSIISVQWMSLQNLHMSNGFAYYHRLGISLDSKILPNLCHLEVKLYEWEDGPAFHESMENHHPSSTLGRIFLNLNLHEVARYFEMIDKLLTEPSFSHLRYLVVHPNVFGDFPLLKKKGMLRSDPTLLCCRRPTFQYHGWLKKYS